MGAAPRERVITIAHADGNWEARTQILTAVSVRRGSVGRH